MSGPRTHNKNDLVVITGAGGFIGGHLVSELVRQGHSRVRAVDIKPFDDWYQLARGVDNRRLDLRAREACEETARGARYIYNLACVHAAGKQTRPDVTPLKEEDTYPAMPEDG